MTSQPPSQKEPSPWVALGVIWDLLAAIAIPVVAFGFAGRWLDKRYQTTPWFSLLGLALAFIVAGVITKRRAEDIKKRFLDTKS